MTSRSHVVDVCVQSAATRNLRIVLPSICPFLIIHNPFIQFVGVTSTASFIVLATCEFGLIVAPCVRVSVQSVSCSIFSCVVHRIWHTDIISPIGRQSHSACIESLHSSRGDAIHHTHRMRDSWRVFMSLDPLWIPAGLSFVRDAS